MRTTRVLPLLALALAVAACGTTNKFSSSATATTSIPQSGGVHVTMKNLAFQPASFTAKVGETVVWVNQDSPPHNVTYLSGPKFQNSPQMNPGATYQIKLTQAGTIHYYCTIHPFMKGTIVVTK